MKIEKIVEIQACQALTGQGIPDDHMIHLVIDPKKLSSELYIDQIHSYLMHTVASRIDKTKINK